MIIFLDTGGALEYGQNIKWIKSKSFSNYAKSKNDFTAVFLRLFNEDIRVTIMVFNTKNAPNQHQKCGLIAP